MVYCVKSVSKILTAKVKIFKCLNRRISRVSPLLYGTYKLMIEGCGCHLVAGSVSAQNNTKSKLGV